MILNLEARLKYAEARNFSIKKIKKITACTLAAFPRFLKPLTRGWALNV